MLVLLDWFLFFTRWSVFVRVLFCVIYRCTYGFSLSIHKLLLIWSPFFTQWSVFVHFFCIYYSRRICYCTLGFPHSLRSEKGKEAFVEEVARVEEFLKDPWRLRVKDGETVQVKVPKVVMVAQPPLAPAAPLTTNYQPQQQQRKEFSIAAVTAPPGDGGGGGVIVDLDEAALENASAQTKRIALQKKAAAASVEAEDFARRFEAGDLMGTVKDVVEEQGQSNVKIMCRLCFSGENEGTERARKMLPCKSCGKKYHRNCLKAWSQNRDLFHWSSWACPSCRICEICRRTGDPNKFMFCRRCDAAYHCYCQHPPHKNVSSGPYLCPKHTRCHSCGSSVPGNGLSVRWFLGYTCCDACGRLFVKGNYCPVCLKVYRDSESTPMVCCDICQRWVHCQCDGISDEKYLQFQVDGNLQYVCPTCRGECYQVRNPEEAVQELWRRRDEADRDLIASLRAAAGLPTQEEIFSISPFSDDEDNGPATLKNEYGRSLKFSLKGMVDKSPKKSKEYGKKSSNKKYGKKKGYQASVPGKTEEPQNFEGHSDLPSYRYSAGDKNEELQTYRSSEPDIFSSPVAGSLNEEICSTNQAGVLKHKFIDDVTASNGIRTSRTVQIKSNAPHGSNSGMDIGNHAGMSKTAKGTKLVIHLGSRNKNLTSPPRSDASSCQKEPDMTTSNGSEDVGQIVDEHGESHVTASMFGDGKGDKIDYPDQIRGSKSKGKEGPLIKIRKHNSEVTVKNSKFADAFGTVSAPNTRSVLGKRTADGSTAAVRTETEVPASRGNKVSSMKYAEGQPDISGVSDEDNSRTPSMSNSLMKDSRPLLKLKFKKPQENQNFWMTAKDEEMSLPKGQRSKRKRPSPSRDKASTKGDDHTSQWYQDSAMDEIMDANWILQKLGKDAVGKRVEVHQPSDNSWHRGTVVEVFDGTSMVSVALDDGKARNLELGKQGVRFVSQKQKR